MISNRAEKAEGVGLGFRHDMASALLDRAPEEVRWLEVHPENYVGRGGRFAANLERALASWPVVPHGLTQHAGGDPDDRSFAHRVWTLATARSE